MSKLKREGYLMIDHRASPGLPPDFCWSIGLDCPSIGANTLYESPVITCCHCNVVMILNPKRTRPRGYCSRCDDYVCASPSCNLECTPFERVLDEAEKRARRSVNRIAVKGMNNV